MGGGAEEESTTCDMGQTRTKLSERRPNLNPLFSFRRIEFGSRG